MPRLQGRFAKLLAWVWFVIVTTLLVIPDPSLLLGRQAAEEVSAADKLVHGVILAVMVGLFAWAYVEVRSSQAQRVLIRIVATVAVYAVATELAQGVSPQRSFDPADILSGWLGCLAAWGAAGAWIGWRRRRPSSTENERHA